MQRNSIPLAWNPKGVSNTLDATHSFDGAMAQLVNLIPDPSTPRLWQCRPAATRLIDFSTQGGGFSSGFSSGFQVGYAAGATFISCLKVVGDFAYGLVASSLNTSFDQPFCFNLLN